MTVAQLRERVRQLSAAGHITTTNMQIGKMGSHACLAILSKYPDFQFSDDLTNTGTHAAKDTGPETDVNKKPAKTKAAKKKAAKKKIPEPEQGTGDMEDLADQLASLLTPDDDGQGGGSPKEDNPLSKVIAHAAKPHLCTAPPTVPEDQLVSAIAGALQLQQLEAAIKEAASTEKITPIFQKLEEQIAGLAHELESKVSVMSEALAPPIQKIVLEDKAKDYEKELTGLFHKQLPEIHDILQCRTHDEFPLSVWLWGAAGGGKTTLIRHLGDLLSLRSRVISMGPTYSEAKLLGYRNLATGEYIEGEIREYYEHGGVIGLDEIDSSDPGVVISSNALLSNDSFHFPCGTTVQRSKDFYCVALANTIGTGATGGYTRNKLDAATLDRFVPIKLEYDKSLERTLAAPFEAWADYIHKVRTYLDEICCPTVMGMRKIVAGASMLRRGIDIEYIRTTTLALLPPDVRDSVNEEIPLPTIAA